MTIPDCYSKNDQLTNAYERGFNHGHGFACHNVPKLGQKLFVEDMGRVTVTEDNIREVHQACCFEAESNSRDFSPFAFIASEFNSADSEPEIVVALFNRFELELPFELVGDCSHQGKCDDDCKAWAKKFPRPDDISPDDIRAELDEVGAWSEEELADDDQNWVRLLWIAAGNVKEERAQLPSSEELWEAFEEGLTDAIHSDLETYTDEDYGIDPYPLGENAPEGFTDYQLPESWASYLINKDHSGLKDAEKAEIDEWLEKEKPGNCVGCSEEGEFVHHNDVGALAGNCLWFRFQTKA